MKILVSACLLGENCKYNGGNNFSAAVAEFVRGKEVLPICPEMMSGMGCPRTPIEIAHGVLVDRNGNNVDEAMGKAVAAAMAQIRQEDIQLAILQSRSPTCGVNQVYDGTFSGKLIPGSGILAQALKDEGYPVMDAEDIASAATLLGELESYLDAHYWDTSSMPLPCAEMAPCAPAPMVRAKAIQPRLAPLRDLLSKADAGFSETLLKRIDKSGKKDSEIYKKACISKQHFSKIRNNRDYKPTKQTALALAIALELDLEETKDLIGRAGYALSNSSKFDLIVRYFIEQKNYNIVEINIALYEFDQSLLGS